MERLDELITHLEDEMEIATQEWVKKLQSVNANSAENTKVIKIIQETVIRNPDTHVVITFLRSSTVTGSHEFKLSVYNDEAFVDKPIYQAFLDIKSLFAEAPNYAERIIKKLSPPFVHILPSEKEEIKRVFITKLYQQSYHFFEQIVKEMMIDDQQHDQQMNIYFSGVMGGLLPLGAR